MSVFRTATTGQAEGFAQWVAHRRVRTSPRNRSTGITPYAKTRREAQAGRRHDNGVDVRTYSISAVGVKRQAQSFGGGREPRGRQVRIEESSLRDLSLQRHAANRVRLTGLDANASKPLAGYRCRAHACHWVYHQVAGITAAATMRSPECDRLLGRMCGFRHCVGRSVPTARRTPHVGHTYLQVEWIAQSFAPRRRFSSSTVQVFPIRVVVPPLRA